MKSDLKKFEKFLINSGAAIVPPTNPWELLRFKCPKGTGIVYKNKAGKTTYCGPARGAWNAFTKNQEWSFGGKIELPLSQGGLASNEKIVPKKVKADFYTVMFFILGFAFGFLTGSL